MEKCPKWIDINNALENSCWGLSARWLLDWLPRCLQHVQCGRTPVVLRLQQATDTSTSFIKWCAHRNIQSKHGSYSLCTQQVATYMRHRLYTFPPTPYLKLFALLVRVSQRNLALRSLLVLRWCQTRACHLEVWLWLLPTHSKKNVQVRKWSTLVQAKIPLHKQIY